MYSLPLVLCFVFCMFIFKPVFSASVSLLDIVCICLCICDSRQMSSTKSKSSNCSVNVHWMECWPCLTVSLIIHSITMININCDKMHPCLTPVFTSNVSDNFPLWMTWQVEFSGLVSQTLLVFHSDASASRKRLCLHY